VVVVALAEVGEVGVDPGNRGELALGRAIQEVSDLADAVGSNRQELVDVLLEQRQHGQVVKVVAPAVAFRSRPEAGVEAVEDRAHPFVDLYAVRRLVGIAVRLARHREEPVGDGRTRQRRVPAIRDGERPHQLVVGPDLRPVVVAHDEGRRGVLRLVQVVLNEPLVASAKLHAHVRGRVPEVGGKPRTGQTVHGYGHTIQVGVGLRAGQTIDGLSLIEPEIAEQVVEGTVLEHENDDVVDLVEA
jgi:hypothetical protein